MLIISFIALGLAFLSKSWMNPQLVYYTSFVGIMMWFLGMTAKDLKTTYKKPWVIIGYVVLTLLLMYSVALSYFIYNFSI
jgi:hypothetical protein